MNLFRNLQSDESPTARALTIIIRFLPIGIAVVFIYLLSGGFPPATWTTLAEVLIHWNTLAAQKGANLTLPLIILIVQSLLLLFAWGALLWIIIREINMALRGDYWSNAKDDDDEEISAETLSLLTWLRKRPPATNQDEDEKAKEAPVPVTSIRAGAKAAAKKRAANAAALQAASATTATSLTAPTATRVSNALKNPFEDEGSEAAAPPPSQPQTTRRIAKPASTQPQPTDRKQISRASEPTPPAAYKARDPFDVQADILDIFQNPDLLGDELTLPISQPEKHQLSPEEAISVPLEDVDEPAEEEDEFTFGNPFEGPLPEIFHYDTDLKQSLKDIGHEIEEPAPAKSKSATKKRAARSDKE